jgi:hypothetical protein
LFSPYIPCCCCVVVVHSGHALRLAADEYVFLFALASVVCVVDYEHVFAVAAAIVVDVVLTMLSLLLLRYCS